MTTGDHALNGYDHARARGFINHDQMHAYHDAGLVTPLSRMITDHVRFADRWWIADRNGWHLITDDVLIHMLDTQVKWVEGNVYLGGRVD
jgi:hypothetical protein